MRLPFRARRVLTTLAACTALLLATTATAWAGDEDPDMQPVVLTPSDGTQTVRLVRGEDGEFVLEEAEHDHAHDHGAGMRVMVKKGGADGTVHVLEMKDGKWVSGGEPAQVEHEVHVHRGPATTTTSGHAAEGRNPMGTVLRWLMTDGMAGGLPNDPLEGWFEGGANVPMAGLRDALVAEGWTAQSLQAWFLQHLMGGMAALHAQASNPAAHGMHPSAHPPAHPPAHPRMRGHWYELGHGGGYGFHCNCDCDRDGDRGHRMQRSRRGGFWHGGRPDRGHGRRHGQRAACSSCNDRCGSCDKRSSCGSCRGDCGSCDKRDRCGSCRGDCGSRGKCGSCDQRGSCRGDSGSRGKGSCGSCDKRGSCGSCRGDCGSCDKRGRCGSCRSDCGSRSKCGSCDKRGSCRGDCGSCDKRERCGSCRGDCGSRAKGNCGSCDKRGSCGSSKGSCGSCDKRGTCDTGCDKGPGGHQAYMLWNDGSGWQHRKVDGQGPVAHWGHEHPAGEGMTFHGEGGNEAPELERLIQELMGATDSASGSTRVLVQTLDLLPPDLLEHVPPGVLEGVLKELQGLGLGELLAPPKRNCDNCPKKDTCKGGDCEKSASEKPAACCGTCKGECKDCPKAKDGSCAGNCEDCPNREGADKGEKQECCGTCQGAAAK